MRVKPAIAAVLVLALVGQQSGIAAANPLELRWNELAPLISGKAVDLTVPGGARLRGEVVTIREDALLLDLKQSSDLKAFPKGNAVVPRASVSTLSVTRERGKWGRRMGTTVGTLAGLSVGGYTAAKSDQSAGATLAIFTVIAAGVIVGGYYLGRSLDTRKTQIHVTP